MPRRSWRRRPRASAPARGWSSPPSSRCAAIRPRTCVLRPAFLDACARELAALAGAVRGERRSSSAFPSADGGGATTRSRCCATAASPAIYRKQRLPNYTVFDEERYFDAGERARASSTSTACAVGLVICEDCWFPGPARQAKAAGAQLRRRRQRLAVPHAAAGAAPRAGRRPGARDRAPDRLRQPRRRPGRARVRRRVVRRRRRAATSRSSCRRGTRRSRSRRSTGGAPSRCAARSTPARAARLRRRW